MGQATPAQPTQVFIGDALTNSPSSPEGFDEITGISGEFTLTREGGLQETPHLGDSHQNHTPSGLPSASTQLVLHYVPGNAIHERILAFANDEDAPTINFQVLWSGDSPRLREQFSAKISGYTRSAPVGGVLTYTFPLLLQSKPVEV
jgi:hypothetical protein